jgi:hypothetical protein
VPVATPQVRFLPGTFLGWETVQPE